jgi:hypothetical protein
MWVETFLTVGVNFLLCAWLQVNIQSCDEIRTRLLPVIDQAVLPSYKKSGLFSRSLLFVEWKDITLQSTVTIAQSNLVSLQKYAATVNGPVGALSHLQQEIYVKKTSL